jgi:hypothetical protein
LEVVKATITPIEGQSSLLVISQLGQIIYFRTVGGYDAIIDGLSDADHETLRKLL